MTTKQQSTKVKVSFTDSLLNHPLVVSVPYAENSRNFLYSLRRILNKEKRIAPINQTIKKVGDKEYTLTVRKRSDNLNRLTIHGHQVNEYDVYVDDNDSIMDIKFLLAPLIDAKPEYIQLNYNTSRRLSDDENVIKSNCLSSDIVIMFWLEIPNPDSHKGESCIYRACSHLTTINPLYPDMGTTVRKVLSQHPDTKTFGVREYLDKNDFTKRGEYKWSNFKITNERVTNFSSGLRNLGLIPKQSKVGICSQNRAEWIIADYSANVQSMVTIPLYPLDDHYFEYVINHSELECIVCSSDVLYQLNKARSKCPTLKYIILMDDELPDQIYAKEKDFKRETYTHLFSEIEKLGINKRFDDVLPATDSLSTIMYTSGTTGPPKGVMLTHRNLMCILNTYAQVDTTERDGIIDRKHLSYLPLAHSYERVVNLLTLLSATPVGFWSGSVDKLIEDMNILKPVVFFGVPRVFQKFQDAIMNKINQSNFLIRAMFNYAYKQKLDAINRRKEPSKFWDRILFSKFREPFGGAIRFAGSGSAPLSKENQTFLKVCLFENIGEGYGLTETTTAGSGSHEFDVKVGHVGMVRTSVELKLVSVPSMNYMTNTNPARGEIWMRGAPIFKGYYKQPEKTKAVLSDDGWFATGDVGLWRPEGRLEIIDRIKNIFKLAQGEYIRPEYIQNVYKLGRFIGNCFVTGNSFETYLVAIIVPDFEALLPFINDTKNGMSDLKGKSKEIIVLDERVINLVKECMKQEEEKGGLKGFEKVRKFMLKYEEFTLENGLLTNSMKLKRNVARKRFENEIKQLYKMKSKL